MNAAGKIFVCFLGLTQNFHQTWTDQHGGALTPLALRCFRSSPAVGGQVVFTRWQVGPRLGPGVAWRRHQRGAGRAPAAPGARGLKRKKGPARLRESTQLAGVLLAL